MSLTTGYCLVCKGEVSDDLETHFAQVHEPPAEKPRVQILSIPHRLDMIMEGLRDVKAMSDPKDQVSKLDELLPEFYVLRSTLYQREKAGN
jgi:hypothetical protein